MRQGIDTAALERLPKKYPHGPDGNKTWLKFADWRFYGARAIESVMALGLDNCFRKRILDVGCGFGYFVRAARLAGHDVTGLDIEDPLYREVWGLMRVPVIGHALTYQWELPEEVGDYYDLITMFGFGLPRICGGNGQILRSANCWDEYQETLEKLLDRIKPNGRLYCVVNVGRDWLHNREQWRQLADSVGGSLKVDRHIFTITKGPV
jgi:SAM-dependent methyltransferase